MLNKNPQAPFNKRCPALQRRPVRAPRQPARVRKQRGAGAFHGVLWPRTVAEASSERSAAQPQGRRSHGAQSTSNQPKAGGGNSEFTFNLARNEGQQYLASERTVLPAGLVGKIPTVPQCTEAQVKADEAQNIAAGCPLASKVGTVTATAGSGTPYTFTGNVYLTAPLAGEGAPYGLSVRGADRGGPVQPRLRSHALEDRSRTVHRAGDRDHAQSADHQGRHPDQVAVPEREHQRAELHPQPDQLRRAGDRIHADLHVGRQRRACPPRSRRKAAARSRSSRRSRPPPSGKYSKANGASLETTINQPGRPKRTSSRCSSSCPSSCPRG